MYDRVSLDEKFAQFSEHWSPKVVGELNGQMVKVAKFQGAFVWHRHDAEDDSGSSSATASSSSRPGTS